MIGATPASPSTGLKLQIIGNSVFSYATSTITSSALIRGNNLNSEAPTTNGKGPDYTWYNDDNTGLFHPATGVIGFAISGAEKMRLHSNGYLGLGSTAPASLFSVGGNGNSLYMANFYSSATANGSVGVYSSIATPTSSSNIAYCIYGAMTSGTGYAYGIKGSSYNATGLSGRAFGVYGQAGGSTDGYNCGVYGQLLGNMLGTGVYGADASNSTQQNVPGQFAGYFAGKIRTTNDVPEKPTAGSWTGYSDMRLKKDTAAFKDGLDVLRKVNPVTYKFTGAGNLPSQQTYIGVVAQQIQKVAPYCVGTGKILLKQSESSQFGSDIASALPADSAGVAHNLVNAMTFNYDALVYVLINSVKQLDSTVTVLQKQLAAKTGQRTTNNNPDSAIKALQKQVDDLINNCCTKTGQNTTNQNNTGKTLTVNTNTLSINNAATLYANVPNPFNVSTNIKCFIPEASKSASLLIFDMNGTLKKTIVLNGNGDVNTTINAKELIAGMYFYTLIIDGTEIDTKKMILTEQ